MSEPILKALVTALLVSGGVQIAAAQSTYRDYATDGDVVVGGRSSLYGGQLMKPVLRWTEPAGRSQNSGVASDCDNNPGLRKNLEQFGRFIPAAIMGNDDRCPLSYAPNAPEIERQFYGVVDINYSVNDRKCGYRDGSRCASTGHLVADGDIVVTAAHSFRDPVTKRRLTRDEIIRGFNFTVRVWVPPSARYDQREEYEYRIYKAVDIEFGSDEVEQSNRGTDFAFIKLNRRVGAIVGPTDDNGVEDLARAVNVSPDRQVRALPFKRFDRKSSPNVVMTVGFQADKPDGDAHKNCRPFKLYDLPPGNPLSGHKNALAHDGDTNGVASGSALAMMVDGRPHFAGIHVAGFPDGGLHYGEFDLNSRFNVAVDGQSIYDRFMAFRRKHGRN